MQCPRCHSDLKRSTWEADIVVATCISCGGTWLDKGELERIEETVEIDYADALRRINTVAEAYELARQEAQADLRCPSCSGDLAKEEYGYCSQILIDLCPACGGIWLDRGELAALETFFERERGTAREHGVGAEVFRSFLASLASLFKA